MRLLIAVIATLNLASAFEVELSVNSLEHGLATVAKRSLFTWETENLNDKLKYYVYTRENMDRAEIIEADVESVIRNVFDPLKPTTISIHGVFSERDSPENRVIISTKLAQDDCNIIVVDYSSLVHDSYEDAAALAPSIGTSIADFIILLHKNFDVSLESIHLVGFSLGAQIAGFVGQSVRQKLGRQVQHITGLDPSGRIFQNTTNADEHLSKDDAVFVEVIHTNGGTLGYFEPCGHADYYPNGGRSQPNCDADDDGTCSHIRAYELVREMWSSEENQFVTTKCAQTYHMNLDRCRWVNVKMGENVLREGLYYLKTNGVYPYGLGAFVASFM